MKFLILICLAGAAMAFPQGKFGNGEFVGIKGFRTPTVSSGISPLIVGGKDAVPHSVPYQISYQYKDGDNWYHGCGGSIVEADKIITAAHCVLGVANGGFESRVVAGEHDLTKSDGAEQVVAIAKAISHPEFSYTIGDYDYAVLRLAANLTFNKNVAPIRLPTSDFVPSGTCKNTGWGNTHGDGTVNNPNILQEVALPLVDNEECNRRYNGNPFEITEHMVCAGDAGKGPCHGDSGGPLVCNGVLTGIVSWGHGAACAQAQYPGVFANVATGLTWLAAQ